MNKQSTKSQKSKAVKSKATTPRVTKSKTSVSSKKTPASKPSRFFTKAGLGLVIIGLLIGGFSLFSVWLDQRSAVKPQPLSKVLSNKKAADNAQSVISGTPVHISLPSVNIDLNVIPGYYYPSTQTWTLTSTNAQYAVMTARANNKAGDTFIYGHALMNVFGRLPGVKPGDKVLITTDNGHTFTYTFQTSSITTPDDTSLFDYKGKPVLILQTCTGAHFQNRQLFVFNLSGVS
jgi:LPXTG-site transpeptidase (sortase) family protein